MPPVRLSVFLLDDHEVVRTGLRALLEAADDIEVVGEAGTVAEALSRIPPTKPNVAGNRVTEATITRRTATMVPSAAP